jgi:hypothetical protein
MTVSSCLLFKSNKVKGVSCVAAFSNFLSHKDQVSAVYTDNSRLLIATIGELGHLLETPTTYVDSSNNVCLSERSAYA